MHADSSQMPVLLPRCDRWCAVRLATADVSPGRLGVGAWKGPALNR